VNGIGQALATRRLAVVKSVGTLGSRITTGERGEKALAHSRPSASRKRL
jgi:hypothetical protein